MGAFQPGFTLPVVAGLVVASASVAEAAMLTFSGQVHLYEPGVAAVAEGEALPDPVAAARVTVTFHGHEAGITEYTTERTVRTVTDDSGFFAVDAKLSDYRYRWTHVTIAVSATDVSKATTVTATLNDNGQGGGQGTKAVWVMPHP